MGNRSDRRPWVTHFSFRSGLLLLLLWGLWTLWATRLRVVHKSTGLALEFAQTVAAMSDDAECDRPVRGDPVAVLVFNETNRLADQRFADVDRVALPLDLAVVAHAPDRVVGPVARLAQDAIEASRRDGVVLGRGVVAEGLVRALFIVEGLEAAQALELLSQAPRRRVGGVLQQRQMQPLQSTVLLRLAGRNALRHHPGLDHLDRQLRQPARPARGKRRSIVGAQPMRKAELAECRIEHWPYVFGVGARHRLAAQQIPAVGVAQRQRLAMRAVAGQEPALEIDAPHIIRRPAMRKRRARWRAAATQTAPDRQALAVEQRPDRAGDRPWRLRCAPLKPCPHLHRSPGRMRPPHRQATLGALLRHRLRMMQRRARAVHQTFNARFSIALKPLVAALPAHTEAPAHRRKRLFSCLNHHHKAHPLVHGTGLHPSHRQGPPRRSVDLLPMSPVRSVTYVAGLDPAATLPLRGRDWSRRRAIGFTSRSQPPLRGVALLLRARCSYPSPAGGGWPSEARPGGGPIFK